MSNAQSERKKSKETFSWAFKKGFGKVWWAFISIIVVVAIFVLLTYRPSGDSTRVALQLKWILNAGFSGDLVAEKQGLWKDLVVEVRSGGVGVDPIRQVVSGQAQFGVATGDQLLLARSQGYPLIAIALVYQENPLAWIVKDSSQISRAVNLKQRKVGLTYIDDEPLFRAMMARVGLGENDVILVPVKFDLSPFNRGEIDAYPVFRNTQGVQLQQEMNDRNVRTHFISPHSEGVISYSNLYFTTRNYAAENPRIVQAFVNGVLRGWIFTRQNVDSASKIVSTFDKETALQITRLSVIETNRLVSNSVADTIGIMTIDGWSRTEGVLRAVNLLKGNIALDSLFTNDFVRTFYRSEGTIAK